MTDQQRPNDGAMCAAARDRRPVRYTSRGRTAIGTLVYWPGANRRPHPLDPGSRSASSRTKAKVRTALGRFLTVDCASVELIDEQQ